MPKFFLIHEYIQQLKLLYLRNILLKTRFTIKDRKKMNKIIRDHILCTNCSQNNDYLKCDKNHAYLHRYSLRRDQFGRAALHYAGAVSTCLQKRQLVGGQTDYLDQAIVHGRFSSATSRTPRMRSAAVGGDVQEQYGVDPVLSQFRRHVLTIAFQRHEIREVLPLREQQVLAAHLSVEQFVPHSGVKLLRVSLYK